MRGCEDAKAVRAAGELAQLAEVEEVGVSDPGQATLKR